MAPYDTSDEQRFARALLRRAEDDRRRLLDEAEADRARLRQEAQAQLDRLRAERLDAARRRAQARLAVRLSDERCRQRAEETLLFDDACRRAVDLARARLERLREQPEYPALLGRLIDEAVGELRASDHLRPSDDFKAIVDPRDRKVVLDELQRRGLNDVAVETGGPLVGGVQLVADGGQCVIDNTFEARLRARLPAIRTRLAKLFSADDEALIEKS